MINPLFYKELIIPSTVEGLNMCLMIVDQIGKYFGMDFNTKFSLQTIVVESVENAIIHGNKNNRDLVIKVSFTVNVQHVLIRVEDQGDGFDINSIPSPLSKQNLLKESGRGIFFIKSLCSSCVTLGHGNILLINMVR